MINTNMRLRIKGSVVSSFEDMVSHRKGLFFQYVQGASKMPYEEIMKVIPLFLKSISEEMNDSLQEGILEK
jgi:hypothetical protein